jgi:hypothetical protein
LGRCFHGRRFCKFTHVIVDTVSEWHEFVIQTARMKLIPGTGGSALSDRSASAGVVGGVVSTWGKSSVKKVR